MGKVTRVWVLAGVVTLANVLLAAEADKATTTQVVQANSDFATDLYQQLAKENAGENLFFSPYSISSALAMTTEGARGLTADEMGKVLRFPAAARRAGDDAQSIPWEMLAIHTGIASINRRINRTDEDPQQAAAIRSKIAELSKQLDAAKQHLAELRKQRAPEAQAATAPLFQEWRNEMAMRSFSNAERDAGTSDTWVHWLIEAQVAAPDKNEWFLRKLEGWLKALNEKDAQFDKQWRALARLTKDLPGGDELQHEYPTFYEVALPDDSGKSEMRKARQQSLTNVGAGACLPISITVWKKWLRRVVPDPTRTHKSDYTWHALWMKALRELNRGEYDQLLGIWRITHRRRRNLWRDMQSQHLPI